MSLAPPGTSAVSPVAIVGAGWLGAALARRLEPPVIVTSRTGQWPGAPAPAGIEVRQLDVIVDPLPTIRRALHGARAVVVCYAPGAAQDRRQLYVEGGRRLADVASGLPLRRLVYVSSTSALPDLDGWIDESCTLWPAHERGRIQREGEDIFISRCQDAGIPWIVLRLAGLYGPGRELDRIYRRRSSDPLPGDGMAATNLVHRDDALAVLASALELDSEVCGVVHVCDDDHTPRREMYQRMAQTQGLAPVQWQAEPAPVTHTRGKRVSNARMKTWLGITLLHPRHTPAS